MMMNLIAIDQVIIRVLFLQGRVFRNLAHGTKLKKSRAQQLKLSGILSW